MGCCSSSSSERYVDKAEPKEKAQKEPAKGAASGKASQRPTGQSLPDFGLSETHEVVKMLGRGGEGETWLLRQKGDSSEVAIKLIKRPIPKAALAVIEREIKIQVRPSP
jgi:serine/threonine-protein kinase SRK2